MSVDPQSISLLIGLGGVLLASASLAWAIWRDSIQWWVRLQIFCEHYQQRSADPKKISGFVIRITVANIGQSTALVQSIGIQGIATESGTADQMLERCVNAERYSRGRLFKAKVKGSPKCFPEIEGEAKRLVPGDAWSVELPVQWNLLEEIPGKYWNATVTLRNGRVRVVRASEVLNQERPWANWFFGCARRLPRHVWLNREYLRRIVATEKQIKQKLLESS